MVNLVNNMIHYDQTCSDVDIFDKTEQTYKESNSLDALRSDVLYGVDPLQIDIRDYSINRTWPISSYSFTISTNNIYHDWFDAPPSFKVSKSNTQDTHNYAIPLTSVMFRYGDYRIDMNVRASYTATSGDRIFTQYIHLSEFEPYAFCEAVSANTVQGTYTADTGIIVYQQITTPNAASMDNEGTDFGFVSGYAPELTVIFQDKSDAHTFPISSYSWDFGDPYNEGPDDTSDPTSNFYSTTATTILSGDFNHPTWITDKTGERISHTYTMPGTYNVSLKVAASATGTTDIHSRYQYNGDDKGSFYVYVQEILPTKLSEPIVTQVTPFSASADYYVSPVTAWFAFSGVKSGSFPIETMTIDFGDGEAQTITKLFPLSATDDGLAITLLSAYAINDPRNYVIPHVYTNFTDTPSTFNVEMFAHAGSTFSSVSGRIENCIGMPIHQDTTVTSILTSFDDTIYDSPASVVRISDNKKIISNRVDGSGNMICVIEGQNRKNTYTIALSGEITND